jgi:hypothetical protein
VHVVLTRLALGLGALALLMLLPSIALLVALRVAILLRPMIAWLALLASALLAAALLSLPRSALLGTHEASSIERRSRFALRRHGVDVEAL